VLASAGKPSCWLFTALGRQVWAGRSRRRCRQSSLDWPDNMGLRPMAMPTRTAFLESKISTPEASTQGPPCSYSAKPNRIRIRSKTSVLTSGTCGRKSEFVSKHWHLLNGQNVVNISNGSWSRVDRAAAATNVGFAARHSWCRVKADAWLERSAIHPTALRCSCVATSRLMLECSGRPQGDQSPEGLEVVIDQMTRFLRQTQAISRCLGFDRFGSCILRNRQSVGYS